jgi:hypothetical protein
MTEQTKPFYATSNADEEFHRRREEFAQGSERFHRGEFVDHPFLMIRRQALTPSLFRIKLFEKIIEVQGSIVECGVHRGNNFMLFNHLVSIHEPYNLNRKVIGFDTFEGFRSLTADDDARVNEQMFSDTSKADIETLLEMHDINRAVPHMKRGELVKGDACETIPAYVKANPHLMVALLYIDFDIYEPTKVALEHLAPLVPKGGIIAFDEINVSHWPGETKAVREYFEMNNLRVRRMPFEPYASYAVVGE